MNERKKRNVVNLEKYYISGKFQACSLADDIVFDDNGENRGIYVLSDNQDVIYWDGQALLR
jgi:hypothetical protein